MFELRKLYKHENMRDVHFKVICVKALENDRVLLRVHWFNEIYNNWIDFDDITVKNEDIKKYKIIENTHNSTIEEESSGGYGEDMS